MVIREREASKLEQEEVFRTNLGSREIKFREIEVEDSYNEDLQEVTIKEGVDNRHKVELTLIEQVEENSKPRVEPIIRTKGINNIPRGKQITDQKELEKQDRLVR